MKKSKIFEPAVNFTDNGDGTVTDKVTGLMWQEQDDGKKMTWREAKEYAEGLSLGGYTDWRLPTIKELQSIIDYTKKEPSIDTTFFPSTKASFYWSSATVAGYPSFAWGVDFGDGGVGGYVKTVYNYVRCVRF